MPSSDDRRPSPLPSQDPQGGGLPPYREKIPTIPDRPSGRASHPSIDDDELTARKKDLVAAFDKLIAPLDEILVYLKRAWRGGACLLLFSAAMVAVQVHTTIRMMAVQEQLAEVVEAQRQLQQTASKVEAKQTAAEEQQAQQSIVTLEPSTTPDGAPTTIVVVKPPSASSTMAPVPFGITTAPQSAPKAPPRKKGASTDAGVPASPPPASVQFEGP
jgi:hypothetical protein